MFIVEREFHGKKLSMETGRIAKQASGAVVVRYHESMVLVTACSGEPKLGGDFLPLTIDYVEKTYAAGRIPGSFYKREGKLSDKETLTSRLMDRPCRPLFPEGYNKETQVIATVISADGENETDVLAVVGASAALTLSDMPFEGPIAAVRVGRIGGKLVINPTNSQLHQSDLNFVVAGSRDAIVMVEGEAKEASEQDVLDALFYAHAELQVLIDMQLELQKQYGKPKMKVAVATETESEFPATVEALLKPQIDKAIRIKDKLERRDAMKAIKESAVAQLISAGDEDADGKKKKIGKVFEDLLYTQVREMIVREKVRIDGRDYVTVRPISIEPGFLPRTHGSALFTRGETQAIVVATLGTEQEAQRLDSLSGESAKRFMLHYNFPPFSVGETKPVRGPGRREIGHGALAERAIKAVLPSEKEFPYVVRIVSEITESNGSSSMATVCGSSLALMDAGVPIKAAVAGVAMGLIKFDDEFVVLTDILGDEDHLGDMDFKVCGTGKGIAALQMDIKIKGLSREVMSRALTQAREARLHVLERMNETLATSRSDISKYAPRIVTLKINTERIRDLIGPGGKTIRSIAESCNVKVDVADDRTVSVSGTDDTKVNAALNIIHGITQEAEIGVIYKGVVKRIADFGAFVEILPGTDGLVHISQLTEEKVRRVTDVLREGDEICVKVLDKDPQGKIRLSMKDAVADMKEQGIQG